MKKILEKLSRTRYHTLFEIGALSKTLKDFCSILPRFHKEIMQNTLRDYFSKKC